MSTERMSEYNQKRRTFEVGAYMALIFVVGVWYYDYNQQISVDKEKK